tara:strand:+ start:1485 stop:2042 length:558 start_codon:yes stop_codon:yes gene_type:complete
MNKQFNIIITIFLLIIIILHLFSNCDSKINSRPVWPCPYNESRFKHLYIKEENGKYTSQSLFDIYLFTHLSHGILLFYLLYYLNNYKKSSSMIYFALFFEILWEIIENIPIIINKYRRVSNISRNYAGDSIINSIGDIISMLIGFYIAWNFHQYGLIIFIFIEIILYYYIKDNLITNVYQIFIKK